MKLFEPLNVRNMQLRNRIVMPPMQVNVGLRSRRARAYYGERAQGGAAAVIAAGTSVDILTSDDAWGKAGGADAFVEGLKIFADEIHHAGARVGVQLWHGNRFPAGLGFQEAHGERVAPSAREDMRELTVGELQCIVSKFALAAVKAKEAGLDFVDFHGAHGTLLCQFFSPADNHRTDSYGGDLSGRMRLGVEIVSAARAAAGEDFCLFYRMGAWEDRPGGITIDDATHFAQALEKASIDVLDVSIGRGASQRRYASPTKKHRMGTYVHLAEAIKGSVNVPVIGVGRIHTPEVAEAILSQGRADLVAIGRQLICDPFWPKKVMEGRVQEIVFCDSCNKACFGPLLQPNWPANAPLCRLNERAGREWEVPLGSN